jgi:hypothetical protein
MPRKQSAAWSSQDNEAPESITLTLPRRWVRQLQELARKHEMSVSDVAVLMLLPTLTKERLEIDSHLMFFKAIDEAWKQETTNRRTG